MYYSDNNRGRIQNRERAKQIIDFSGLRYGNITPTDLDGLIEYRDKAFILLEYKLQGVEVPYGQKLAFQRLIDALSYTRPAICFICEHTQTNKEQDINATNALVREVYWCGQWNTMRKPQSVKSMCDFFLYKVDLNKLKML